MAQRAEHEYMKLLARQIVARNWRFRLRGKSDEGLFEFTSRLAGFEAQQLKQDKVPHAAVAFGLVGLASYLYLNVEEKPIHQFSWQAAHQIASEAMGLRPGFIITSREWRRVVDKLRNTFAEITDIYSIIL
jgi:hypothetical protein